MRRCRVRAVVVLGALFILPVGTLCQSTQTDASPQFSSALTWAFPLDVGNVWRYKVTYPGPQWPYPVVYVSIRVSGDTVMPGGDHFRVLDTPDLLDGRYIRNDSGYISYWRTAQPAGAQRVIHLTAPQGTRDTLQWSGYFFSVAGAPFATTLFDQSVTARSFQLDGIVIGRVTVADGFGYIWYEFNGDSGSPYEIWELAGCRIGGVVHGVVDAFPVTSPVPAAFGLLQNYPNPFNPGTDITYLVPPTREAAESDVSIVRLCVYDLLGREVAVLVNENKAPGTYKVRFNAGGLPSGVYFYRLFAGGFTETRKMLLAR